MSKKKKPVKPKQKTRKAPPAPAVSKAEAGAEDAGAEAQAPTKKSSVGALEFFKQVRSEGRKVTWTSRNETFVSTIMVLIMVVIMSLFFLLVDQIFRWIVPMVLALPNNF